MAHLAADTTTAPASGGDGASGGGGAGGGDGAGDREAIDSLSVRELKAMIERAGMTHSDCLEKADLRKRAMELSLIHI